MRAPEPTKEQMQMRGVSRTFATELSLSKLRCEPSTSFSHFVIHLILILNDNVKSRVAK